MNLNIGFDDGSIKKYVGRGRSPIFTIYWTQDGVAYPEEQWLDFGSVLLSWWLVAAKSLLDGATEAELPFMDGPFRLKVRRIGNLLHVSADDQPWQWRTPLETFVAELLRATSQVQQKSLDLGVPDREGLQVGVEQLKAAMSRAKAGAVVSRTVVAERVA